MVALSLRLKLNDEAYATVKNLNPHDVGGQQIRVQKGNTSRKLSLFHDTIGLDKIEVLDSLAFLL